ncbi:MAG: HAD family hydrolase [Desulfitobacteriaceae bacterium]
MIKTIGFDLGYTLVYLPREKPLQDVLNGFGSHRTLAQIEQAYHLADKHFMRHFQRVLGGRPETYYPWYLGVVTHYLGVSVDLLALSEKLKGQQDKNKHWQLYPWTQTVLSELLKRGYRLFLVSNWDHSARDVLKNLELEHFFEEIVISSEVNMEKPEAGIFRLALDRLGVSPHEVLYVGDNYYDDCVGAAKLRIATLLINRFGRLGIEEVVDTDQQIVIEDISTILQYLEQEGKKEVG